jgi:hypothetical protein
LTVEQYNLEGCGVKGERGLARMMHNLPFVEHAFTTDPV